MSQINEAFARLDSGKARYRIVASTPISDPYRHLNHAKPN